MTGARDYIVVGAGSGGCTVAARLIEGGARVTLLEAGPPDRNPLIHIPAGVRHLLNHPTLNWNFASEPEPGTDGRPIHWPRGRTLGGSSAINGMLYVRGNAADYDGWAQLGCQGWSYQDVLPYFRKSENVATGDDTYRGRGGPCGSRIIGPSCRSLTSSSPPPKRPVSPLTLISTAPARPVSATRK